MAMEVFSEEWARKICEKLNQSKTYKKAAKTWEGGLILVDAKEPILRLEKDLMVFFDLWHGECRGARVATEADLEQARFVLKANPFVWLDVLDGKLETISAVMRGKLKLVKGSAIALTKYVSVANELAATARQIESIYEGGFSLVADPSLSISESRTVYMEVYLDNNKGYMKEVRPASKEDLQRAEYIYVASPKTWREITEKKLDLISYLKKEQLKIAKGSILALVPFIKPIDQLVRKVVEIAKTKPEIGRILLEG